MSVIGTSAVQLAGKTVMSGIQPTGVFHIGNLLGAVQTWADFSKRAPSDTKLIFMIADLHSITMAKDPKKLRKMRHEALASVLASGIDPNRCNIYMQSAVPAHTRLHWLLSSVSSMGYLSRMVQWKSKANLDLSASVNNENQISDVNLALFSYPVLQAADILVNEADYVPVGEDQAQHLELTRHIAQSFNHRFPGASFTPPKTVITPFKKILSLRDHTKKMSKSDSDQNACLYTTDSADAVSSKLRRALTDSIQGAIVEYDPETRPAVSNLVLIAAGVESMDPQAWLDRTKPQNHRELKEAVAESVTRHVSVIASEYHRLLQDPAYLERIAREGEQMAIERTDLVYKRAAAAMGF